MANDFSADSNCIALYRFESGALTTDSIGSQTLSTSSTPPAESSEAKEGGRSIRYTATLSEWYYVTDSGLGSTFPFKSGTSNKTISLCTWFRYISTPGSGINWSLAAKFSKSGGNFCTWYARIRNTGTQVQAEMTLGLSDGSEGDDCVHTSALTIDLWYHGTFIYRDSDKFWAIYIRDTNGNTVGSDTTGTASDNIALFSQSDFMLGARTTNAAATNIYDGHEDETVIFRKAITATDATNIAKGLYSGTGDSGGTAPAVSDTATIAENVKMHMPISLKMMKVP